MTLPTSNKEQYPVLAVGRSYDFGFFRQAFRGMWGEQEGILPFNAPPFVYKIDGADTGSGIPGDLKVTTGGSGLNVSVAAGRAVVLGDASISGWPTKSQGSYMAVVPTAETVTLTTAHATLPRIDQLVLRIYDTDVDGGGQIIWDIAKVDGTATAGATLTNLTGAAALPSTAIRLAYILTPAAFAGPYVDATHIREARQIVCPPGTLMYYAAITGNFAPGTSPTKITNLEVNNVLPPGSGYFDLDYTADSVGNGSGAAGTCVSYIYEGTTTGGTQAAQATAIMTASGRMQLVPHRARYAITTTGAGGGKSDFIAATSVAHATSAFVRALAATPATLEVRST